MAGSYDTDPTTDTEQQPLFPTPTISSLEALLYGLAPPLNISTGLGFDQDLPLTLHQPLRLSGEKSSPLLSQ